MKIVNRCATRVGGLVLIALTLLGGKAETAYARQLVNPPVDPAHFTAPMDNPYFPMAIGTTYVYEVETEDGLVVNEISITPCLKTILGVDCVVVYDVEYLIVDGMIIVLEETFDWHAWDNWGNVWYFGEDTIEYEYDEDWNLIGCSTDGTWQGGVDGAQPGIVMLAEPAPGLSYYQEFYEGEAEDQGKVLRNNAQVSIALGDFYQVLVTKEWTKLSPGEVEQKLYAPGVGLVLIHELKEKTVTVELVEVRLEDFDCAQLEADFYAVFDQCQ